MLKIYEHYYMNTESLSKRLKAMGVGQSERVAASIIHTVALGTSFDDALAYIARWQPNLLPYRLRQTYLRHYDEMPKRRPLPEFDKSVFARKAKAEFESNERKGIYDQSRGQNDPTN